MMTTPTHEPDANDAARLTAQRIAEYHAQREHAAKLAANSARIRRDLMATLGKALGPQAVMMRRNGGK